MKDILIKLSVPDEVEPLDVLGCMVDDFFYSNRNTEDFGPHMDNITTEVVKSNDDIIKAIIEILQQPGEDKNDGECLDEVAQLLEEKGWEVFK